MKTSHVIDWGKTAAEIQEDYAAACQERDDLILEKEELQRQLDERGGVLELHRIRVGELEEIIRLMKVIVNQLDCQLEAENAIREETEKLLDGYRDLAIEDVNCARIAIKIARTINHNRNA